MKVEACPIRVMTCPSRFRPASITGACSARAPRRSFHRRERSRRFGGREAVARLVDGLYDRIEADPCSVPPSIVTWSRSAGSKSSSSRSGLAGRPSISTRSGVRTSRSTHAARISISPGMANRWIGHFLNSLAEAANDTAVVGCIEPSISRLAMALVNRADEPAPGECLRGSCSSVETRAFLQPIQRDDPEGVAAAAVAHPKLLPHQGPELLLIAAVRGKHRAIRELLCQGVNPNVPATLPGSDVSVHGLPRLKITPLCGALLKRRDAVATLLVEHGAEYDIFTASCVGDLGAVARMLESAPDSRGCPRSGVRRCPDHAAVARRFRRTDRGRPSSAAARRQPSARTAYASFGSPRTWGTRR